MLYIGIDGGGTKTKMVLFNEDGTRLKNLILLQYMFSLSHKIKPLKY